MKSQKTIKLYVFVDGVNDVPFYGTSYDDFVLSNDESLEMADDFQFNVIKERIEVGEFRYDAKRMGGAPTISFTLMYEECLDDHWNDRIYGLFNNERFFLKRIPTSSYDNTSAMYRHDVELVSERVVLDNIYFFDVVTDDIIDSDKPVSNSTKFVFFGDVREFSNRLNASLAYSGVEYRVEVDDDVVSEEKLVSFEDQFFSNVLQEIYNTYEQPYYFDGKIIRIGHTNSPKLPTFAYGVDDALLSITKTNANYKIVTRATGTGSSDNIPYYYPNSSPKGDLVVEILPEDAQIDVAIVDMEKFSDKVEVGGEIEYKDYAAKINGAYTLKSMTQSSVYVSGSRYPIRFSNRGYKASYFIDIYSSYDTELPMYFNPLYSFSFEGNSVSAKSVTTLVFSNDTQVASLTYGSEVKIPLKRGKNVVAIYVSYNMGEVYSSDLFDGNIGLEFSLVGDECWYYKDKAVELIDLGLKLVDGEPLDGFVIKQRLARYINPTQNLMPYKYRETDGEKRFYDATNDTYDGWVFNNPFVEGRPKEHIVKFDDIKPTIEGMLVNGQGIDMFEAFAFDRDDNDETYEDEEGNVYFKHPYFFAKLKPLGFNLFDHAIEQQPMVISFTSGNCGACSFEIAVDEDTQKNTVQVEGGYVKYDENGRVVCGAEGSGQGEVTPQDIQQDTTNHSVWIALRKEESTYGVLMPQYGIHEPSTTDTFVILGINLPYEYIEAAEKRLEAEIIKYLKDNNDEKFTFSIGFSRIYFAEHPEVLALLNENSKIEITYNNKPYELFVSSFSYSMGEGDVLPDIKVELDATLKVSQNALQNAISEVKSSLGSAINQVSQTVGMQKRSYISKIEDDIALGVVDFSKGIKFGEGGKIEVLDNNSAKLTIEYLDVTKKASFTSLEIQEKTHVGGQILVTTASINCGEVEEFNDYYRCYFQTKGAEGEEIFNQFAVGDQAICQTFNAWGSKYYWRLVVGIGDDYIDLSKTECDSDSDIPSEGDKIIQLGNQVDKARQNAIVIAAYGDGSPYIIQYKGIDGFEIDDKMIVTKLSSTENIFTGKVHMERGSDGLENIEGGLEVGGSNMLRNSGFTGDYLSAQIADQTVLDAVDEMFNPPLIHWDDEKNPAVGATVQDSDISISGKELVLANGHVTQTLYQKVISNESYVVSFKAKGEVLSEEVDQETGELIKKYTSLNVSFGGVDVEIALTDEWAYYTHKIIAKATSDFFSIESSDAIICNIQLERGSIATAWSHSFLDNSSDRVYYQAQKYLSDALKGFTEISGGLILTKSIRVGEQVDNVMTKETAGMNGLYNEDNDIAFWAGGSDMQAINAIHQTGINEANFAVSHGGKVVMNNAIVRGKVYASEGEFKGKIEAYDGVFGGFVKKKVTEVTNGNIDSIAPLKNGYRTITPRTAGSLMYLTSALTQHVDFELPHLWKGVVYDSTNSGYTATDIREMIDSKIVIYNLSNTFSKVCGYFFNEETLVFNTALSCATEGAMNPNEFCYAVCKVGIDSNGYEVVYWDLSKGKI